ncbi:TPA: ethanolamine utilization protein [Streptococcus suis]|uniref:ethanolamine utilization protein n=1 Tax=Streptococcus suis TaxID=1307 RepID=UPI002B11725A|nr:ethanolamine utilization protein [Streptococcus suis]
MDNLEFLVQEITNRLLDRLNSSSHQISLYLIGDKSVGGFLDGEYRIVEGIDEAEHIIANGLSLDSLLRISQLCPNSSEEMEVVTSLLAGRKVLVSKESFAIDCYKQSAKNLLFQELLQRKLKLEQYGVQFYSQKDLPALLKQEHIEVQSIHQTPEKNVSKKVKLITESRLRALELEDDGVFHVEKGTIITALARDYLNRRRITIIE